MPRQITIRAIAVLSMMLAGSGSGVAQNAAYFVQTYTQLGLLSGSGLVYTPSTISSPAAQFRLQLGRIGLAGNAGRGLNVVAVSAGLSSFLEGYLKYTGEQVGSVQSVGSVGVGAKLTIPYVFPILRMVSFWGESATNPGEDRSELYPSNLSRGAMIVTPAWNGYRPALLVGATRTPEGHLEAMEGASLVVTSSHFLQWGIEYVHGYTGAATHHVMFSGVLRPYPYVSLNAGPGYVSTPAVSGWVWSVGVSVNTSDIDFKPVEKRRTKEYKLPTIEELEKGTADNDTKDEDKNDENKNDGKDEHKDLRDEHDGHGGQSDGQGDGHGEQSGGQHNEQPERNNDE